MFSTILILV